LRIVICGAWIGFIPVLFVHTAHENRFPLIFFGWTTYAMFSVAIGGLADALAVARVAATGAVYGRLRFWGSLGFVVAALIVGAILTLRGGRADDAIVPVAMWLALGCAFGAALRVRGTGVESARPRPADVRALIGDPRLRLLLLAAALHWICLAPYNVYFGVFLRDLGLSPLAWAFSYSIGVVAEIGVLLVFHRLQLRFRLDQLLAAAFAATVLRWLAVGLTRSTPVLIGLQALHGLTFGLFWSTAMAMIAATVPGSLRATGQALLVMSINLGGAIGNAVAGRLYDAIGPRTLFLLAAAGELAPLAVVLLRSGGMVWSPDRSKERLP
jgi:PPP family 3-phenylpropionic acid transporter